MNTTTKSSGLILEIYRSNYDSNLNVMNGKKQVVLVGSNMPEIFEASEEMPAIRLVTRKLFGKEYTHAEPLEAGNYAFGGSFVFTSDSRLREYFDYPIPLHDRNMNLEKPVKKVGLFDYLKQEGKSAVGTSFHRVEIKATVNELIAVLGDPTHDTNDGEDKVNFEWDRQTITDDVFTVYDWKEYRPISKDEVITWHIGAMNWSVSNQAKGEIETALKSLKLA
jgi:hypothetical protein